MFFAVWPSSTWSDWPSTTAPIESSSRFSARPSVPPSNSSSSLTAVSGRPGDAGDAVADLEDAPDLVLRQRRRERADVLAQRGCDLVGVDGQLSHVRAPKSSVSSVASDGFLQLLEPVTDRAVDHGVADAGDDAAEHLLVDDDLDLDPLAGRL